MAQVEFNPVEFAGKLGNIEGTLKALIDSVDKYSEDNTKNFDEIFERLRRLESKNGWKGKISTFGYGGGAGTIIMIIEYFLKHGK